MNNKIILGFWFVLFAVLVLLVNRVSDIPVMKAGKLITKIADTDKHIAQLQAIHAEFMLSVDKEDNLFTTENSTIENKAEAITGSIKSDIACIKANNLVTRNPAILISLDDFTNGLTNLENDLQNLFLISHERGNKNSGLVARWLGLSKKMLTEPILRNESQLQKLNQIKQLESEYLLYRDIVVLENISAAAEEIRNQLTPEEGGIDLVDIDSYVVLTGNLMAIEKRMGHASAAGIIPNLENSLHQLPVLFAASTRLMQESVAKIRIWWTIVRYVVILLVISLFIYLFIRSFSIADPLKNIVGFTRKLTNGEFPDEPVAVGNLPDLLAIKESLEKHVSSLQHKHAFIRSINQDVLNTQLNLSSEHDVLGNELIRLQQKILEAAEKQVKNDEENQKRRYMNEGLAKFGDILRSKSNDFNELGDAFIREIVKYLNAVQGGLFAYDDTNKMAPVLNLVSAFAYNRKRYLQNSIAFGEGLVGTCAKEKLSIHLTEIPPDYLSITSGLGDTLPNNLLLVPVIHENEILGVFEIASLHKFENHEIDFAEEVARSLGATIVYTHNNQRTAELLAISRQQALEMAEQEEEMRQNMEELKATQEESGRREEELRGIAIAMNNALLVIEYDLDGSIREVNEKACIFIGHDHDEIVGKLHHEAFDGSFKPTHHFWDEVQKTGHLSIQETIKVGKKSFTLKEHFTTVLSRNGVVTKYINFATDDRIENS
jgi:PAS domain-containing protein